MKLTTPKQGGHFGNLGVYIRGLVTYKLSPFEQKAFPSLGSALPNLARRMTGNLVYMVPPMIMAYMIYTSTEKEFIRMNRKNPQDYVNDK